MITAHQVLNAYYEGVFPMADPDENNTIYWYQPKKRGVIFPSEFHVPMNLKKLYAKKTFDLRINFDFKSTMQACAKREETWISEEIIELYCHLHTLGYAFSFEVWRNDELVGGLYGLKIGKMFFGESMFHTVTDASKIALVFLMDWVHLQDIKLVDCQFITDHLKQFGAKEITQKKYMGFLKEYIYLES